MIVLLERLMKNRIQNVCAYLLRGGIAAVGNSSMGAGFMDVTPGGGRLATPRGNTLLPLGVRSYLP